MKGELEIEMGERIILKWILRNRIDSSGPLYGPLMVSGVDGFNKCLEFRSLN
jgi:hypothetical protein